MLLPPCLVPDDDPAATLAASDVFHSDAGLAVIGSWDEWCTPVKFVTSPDTGFVRADCGAFSAGTRVQFKFISDTRYFHCPTVDVVPSGVGTVNNVALITPPVMFHIPDWNAATCSNVFLASSFTAWKPVRLPSGGLSVSLPQGASAVLCCAVCAVSKRYSNMQFGSPLLH